MRHRRRGRILGRNPKHQRALLRNMVCDLVLTERDQDHPIFDKSLGGDPRRIPDPPRVRGRIVTTVAKAKEVRPLVEKCITIAKKSLPAIEAADAAETDAERGTEAWKRWRESDAWQQWNAATAPALAARRRLIQMLGNREAVSILIDDIAPRYVDRPGGYTRIINWPILVWATPARRLSWSSSATNAIASPRRANDPHLRSMTSRRRSR